MNHRHVISSPLYLTQFHADILKPYTSFFQEHHHKVPILCVSNTFINCQSTEKHNSGQYDRMYVYPIAVCWVTL